MCIPSDSAARKAPKLPEHSGPQIRDYRRQLCATNLVLTPLESLGTRARRGFPWAGVLSNCISLVNSGFSRFSGNLQKQATQTHLGQGICPPEETASQSQRRRCGKYQDTVCLTLGACWRLHLRFLTIHAQVLHCMDWVLIVAALVSGVLLLRACIR